MGKIVMTDSDLGPSEAERALVEAAGLSFAAFQTPGDADPSELIEHLEDADGAITSYGRYAEEVIEALPRLKVISKTGTGVDNIDVDAATRCGVAVCNVVGYGTEVVSDHAIALALACLRRICEMDADMRAGIWDHHRRRPLGQVSGRTFGIIGMGHIGRAVAKKARGLGFDVIAWDRKQIPGVVDADGVAFHALEDVFARADILSFHTALTPETRHLLNSGNIHLLKEGAIVVNTSRGSVIDLDAVAASLIEGRLWGAGIDVFPAEPLPADALIRKAPHTVLTPHAAYWSEESARELKERCTRNAIDVVSGRMPADCVNPEALPRALEK